MGRFSILNDFLRDAAQWMSLMPALLEWAVPTVWGVNHPNTFPVRTLGLGGGGFTARNRSLNRGPTWCLLNSSVQFQHAFFSVFKNSNRLPFDAEDSGSVNLITLIDRPPIDERAGPRGTIMNRTQNKTGTILR